ncbi:AAA family ATPase [Bacillus infantis]|uniref:ATP-binding protein n=1 Tax=Bacillus infantis TaxID=324767 RepID=UPI001CD60472|nr:AAA family ATPase [Bacillus infantis]MCA1039371.1 AAA family ATPase [Bacillus infantis]
MKILEIHIYGYGKLEDAVYSSLGDFQVFFGENEAGKSTIMSFIHSILFGFPSRQQAELRYEPKFGAKYGGRITASFPGRGKAIIERVKGKSAGDVSVVMENGERGGEELLGELLSHVEKTLFQAIFSFNLHGLQNVHSMKNEELSKFLFSAGAIGSDRLAAAENKIQKEMDGLFKPGGKIPVLNDQLKKLKHLHADLKKAEQNNGQYWAMTAERDAAAAKIESMRNEADLLGARLHQLEEWLRMGPVHKKKQLLNEEAEANKLLRFPPGGLGKLEQLNQNEIPLKGRSASLSARLTALQEEAGKISPDQLVLDHEKEILSLQEKMPAYGQLVQHAKQASYKIRKLEEESDQLKDKLHLRLSDEELEQADTSIFMQEKTAQAQRKKQRLAEKRAELDERFSEEKDMLVSLEEELDQVNAGLLADEELADIRHRLAGESDPESLLRKREDIDGRAAFLRNAIQREKATQQKQRTAVKVQVLIAALICAGLIAWGLADSQRAIIMAAIPGFVFIAWLLLKKQDISHSRFLEEELLSIEKSMEELDERIKSPQTEGAFYLKERIEQDRQLRERQLQLTVRLQQQNEQYDKVIAAFEAWEEESAQTDSLLAELGRQLFLPASLAHSHIHDAFLLLEKLKSVRRELRHEKAEAAAAEKAADEIIGQANRLAELILEEAGGGVQETAFILKKRLLEAQGKWSDLKGKEAAIQELKEEKEQCVRELAYITKEKEKLFLSADAGSEEAFIDKGKIAVKQEELQEEIRHLDRQLKLSSLTEEEMDEFSSIPAPEAELAQCRESLDGIKKSLPQLQEKVASLNHEIALIEEGGLYSDLLHKFSLAKSEFNEGARKWAKYALARKLLENTAERYKHEHMPEMLGKAEEFLSVLTGGRYVRITPKEEGAGLLVENRDGTLFEANELSQATAEQVYVSIRLALAAAIYKKYSFPIIIDDSFVNFDHVRTRRMIELLKGLDGHQILFFTCQRHLLEHFDPDEVADLQGRKVQHAEN